MVRFRSFLAGLEVTAAQFVRTWRKDFRRAETPTDHPEHAEPSLYQMMEEARPGRRPSRGQRTGYPFRSDAQADLGHEMVKLLERLAELSKAEIQVDFYNGEHSSPRPKQKLGLRPGPSGDPLPDRPVHT
jgi:hypothetical protein